LSLCRDYDNAIYQSAEQFSFSWLHKLTLHGTFWLQDSGMFHRLPLEIQCMIYNLVLIHVDTIETCQASLQNDILPLPSRVSISRGELSLLAINHDVRSVTLPLFWGENIFCFDASSYSDIRVCTIHTKSYTHYFQEPLSNPKTFCRGLEIQFSYFLIHYDHFCRKLPRPW
jgi:hypothetical protein